MKSKQKHKPVPLLSDAVLAMAGTEQEQAQHTPGPWHVGMKPGPIIYGPKGEQVADLNSNLLEPDETRGNVKLIAAAPELLAACKAVRNGWGKNLTEPMKLINAAITKATT